MSRYGGSADENYLELNKDEKELLAEVHKSFDKVIVVKNRHNPGRRQNPGWRDPGV